MRFVSLIAGASLLLATDATAQPCIGLPLKIITFSAGTGLLHSATSYGGRIGLSVDNQFAGVTLGKQTVNSASPEISWFRTEVGMASYRANTVRPLTFCPLGSIMKGRGSPRIISDRKARSEQVIFTGGFAVGRELAIARRVIVVPNGSVSAVIENHSVRSDGPKVGRPTGTTRNGAQLGAGLSLLLGEILAFQPSVIVPLWLESSEPVLGLSLSMALGRW